MTQDCDEEKADGGDEPTKDGDTQKADGDKQGPTDGEKRADGEHKADGESKVTEAAPVAAAAECKADSGEKKEERSAEGGEAPARRESAMTEPEAETPSRSS